MITSPPCYFSVFPSWDGETWVCFLCQHVRFCTFVSNDFKLDQSVTFIFCRRVMPPTHIIFFARQQGITPLFGPELQTPSKNQDSRVKSQDDGWKHPEGAPPDEGTVRFLQLLFIFQSVATRNSCSPYKGGNNRESQSSLNRCNNRRRTQICPLCIVCCCNCVSLKCLLIY